MVKVVVMAGGRGKRLMPLTHTRPKPMCRIIDKPIIEHNLLNLKKQGFSEFVFTVNYRKECISDYFGDGSDWGVEIKYSVEDKPLGTAGGVKKAEHLIDEDTFVVISGDLFTNWNVKAQLKFHRKKKADVTIGMVRVEDPTHFGVILTDKEGRIIRFLEKPKTKEEAFSNTINAGIYTIEPEILDYIPKGTPYDFSRDLFPDLLEKDRRVFGFAEDSYWIDIGLPGNYLQALEHAMQEHIKPDLDNVKLVGSVWLGEDVDIKEGAEITGPTMILDGSEIGHGVKIKKSIIYPKSVIDKKTEIMGSIVGHGTEIGSESIVHEGSIIGDECKIGEKVHIHPGVKVWPGSRIKSKTKVKKDIES